MKTCTYTSTTPCNPKTCTLTKCRIVQERLKLSDTELKNLGLKDFNEPLIKIIKPKVTPSKVYISPALKNAVNKTIKSKQTK